MAGVLLHATSGEQSLGNGKTILQIVAAANHRVKLQGFTATIKGTAPTDAPVLVQLLRQTSAGAMSGGVLGTNLSKRNSSDSEAIQTTVQVNASSEPVAGDILDTFEIHPQSGWRYGYSPGQEIIIPGGTRLGIRVTTALGYACTVDADLEE